MERTVASDSESLFIDTQVRDFDRSIDNEALGEVLVPRAPLLQGAVDL